MIEANGWNYIYTAIKKMKNNNDGNWNKRNNIWAFEKVYKNGAFEKNKTIAGRLKNETKTTTSEHMYWRFK